MAVSNSKRRYLAEVSIYEFLFKNRVSYYWTFSFAENLEDKEEAERRFKPFRDLVKRKGGDLLVFWERQKRGAWHCHVLMNKFLHVVWLRPWMVERGWGPQMRVEKVTLIREWTGVQRDAVAGGCTKHVHEVKRLVRYLMKYLTKELNDCSGGEKKKAWGGSRGGKAGNLKFSFAPWENPASMLYAIGREFYRQLYGTWPKWTESFSFIVKLGFEETGWGDKDPWFWETFGFT